MNSIASFSSTLNLIVVLDAAIVVLLVVICIRYVRGNAARGADISRVQNIETAFRRASAESIETSRSILESLENRLRDMRALSERLEEQERFLLAALKRADRLAQRQSPAREDRPAAPAPGPHETAAQLLRDGVSLTDVQQRTGLSAAEVELIRNVKVDSRPGDV